MYLIIFGLVFGLIIGSFLQIDIPPELTRYTAVAIVVVLDSIFGAIKASIEKKYNTTVFLSGLGFNIIVAVLITYIGDKLNLDLYFAILIALTLRIFANIGAIKTQTVSKILTKASPDS